MAVSSTRRVRRRIHPGAIYVIPGSHPGLVIPGNINLWRRPVVRNKDGSYSTVHSVSFTVSVNVDGRVRRLEVLMPTTFVGGNVSPQAAYQRFLKTGAHLGMFANVPSANAYADALHNWFVKNKQWFVPPPVRRK